MHILLIGVYVFARSLSLQCLCRLFHLVAVVWCQGFISHSALQGGTEAYVHILALAEVDSSLKKQYTVCALLTYMCFVTCLELSTSDLSTLLLTCYLLNYS